MKLKNIFTGWLESHRRQNFDFIENINLLKQCTVASDKSQIV